MNIHIPARLGFAVAVLAAPCLLSPALAAGTPGASSMLPPGLRAPLYLLAGDSPEWLEQKVTASDGAAYDYFGQSVALDGTTAFVGSPFDTVAANSGQGAVYVFTQQNGAWTFVQKLTSSDGAAGDHFGASVAFEGATAVVGSPSAAVGGVHQGAAYVFTESNGTWSQAQKLSANDGAADDQFGTSVAFDGTTVLVGAPQGYLLPGAAYVFTNSGGAWSQVQKLTQSDTYIYNFGWAVAVDGANALVGADCGYDISLGDCDSSRGYAFAETNGTWNQVGLPYAGGSAVALSGDTAVATNAPYFRDPDLGYSQGTVRIYALSGGPPWTQSAEFYGGSDGYDGFGVSAAVGGNTVLVGADYDTGDFYGFPAPGSVHEYNESNGTWTVGRVVDASDAANYEEFGSAVAVSGPIALFGARSATVGGNLRQGAAYFEDGSKLALAVDAPASVGQGQDYVSQAIATNNATAASPAVAVTVAVPAAASFVAASATQGSCGEDSGVVTCDFGQIAANGGTATANVTLAATGNIGETIENTASVSKATPPLTASAATQITTPNCDAGYTEYDGTLAANHRRVEPDGHSYPSPAGTQNGVLTAPGGFRLYFGYKGDSGGWRIRPVAGNEYHHYEPAGTIGWIVRSGTTGGDFVFCLKRP